VSDLHPYCVRRLLRGARGELAAPDEAPFTHAARLLQLWKSRGVLARDPRPAFYVWEQKSAGAPRRGLVAGVRLRADGAGELRPHEKTRGASPAELLDQLRATRTQLSLVMALLPDHAGALAAFLARPGGEPLLASGDGDGVENRIWRHEDPAAQRELIEALREEPAVIADGHHRHEAAQRWQEECVQAAGARLATTREHPWDYVAMLLVPVGEPGLRCHPTHRVCTQLGDAGDALLAGLDAAFLRHDFETDSQLFGFLDESNTETRFGLVTPGRREGLVLRDDSTAAARALASLPPPLREVDAAILQLLVLDPLEQVLDGGSSRPGDSGAWGSPFSHNRSDGAEVARRAFAGDLDAAILLRPTPSRQVLDVAAAGLLMPPKSTNFLPKPTKGLLMNSLVSF
jgi:uncharacterized protein (DUF1015 family)